MSVNFPNEVYVPTGTADGKDFVQISGYCYKKVESNVTVVNKTVRTDIFGDFANCTECNTCQCGKTIDFFVGGFQYQGMNTDFVERKFSITTSSKGWQEIAIESGALNNNDPTITFKPTQIRCYDRKIDLRSGIYVSFDDRHAEIARFDYVTGADLFERQDLFYDASLGNQGDIPEWGYKNQYDKVGIANTLNTIKFKSLCEYDCPTQDVTFRIRGKINEPGAYLNLGSQYDTDTTSWVYATCTGVPTTPGQIIDCLPSGSGINFTNYFTQGYEGAVGRHYGSRPGGYFVQFSPTSIDVVNLPLLLGETGSVNTKRYSVTGNLHYVEDVFDNNSFYTNWSIYSQVTTTNFRTAGNFYYGKNGDEIDFDYQTDIGQPFGIDYNKPVGCLDYAVTGTDFNTYYRHLGGNTVLAAADFGTVVGKKYEGCYQTSEFADGRFKNGTYLPMYFTGMITGNPEEYFSFISSLGSDTDTFNTGIYVYQWYKSGDSSNANANLTGFFGFMSDGTTEAQHRHYRSMLFNSSPVNMDDPLVQWNIRSGDFPTLDATKENYSFILGFNDNLAYNYAFSRSSDGIRHSGDDTVSTTTIHSDIKNAYDNYAFNATESDTMMSFLDEPDLQNNTFVKPSTFNEKYPLTNSGDALHSVTTSPIVYTKEENTDLIELRELKSIKFQVSWNKE